MRSLITVIITTLLLSIISCSPKDKPKETVAAAAEDHHEEEENKVTITEEQLKAAGIVAGTIEMKNLTTGISVNGTLAVPNQNKALVTSLAAGILQTLNVQPGDYVKKGQAIGTVANTELSGIQQQLISVNAQLKFAQQELKRQKELVAGNAAPYKNLQKAEAEVSSLTAQGNALRKQLSAIGVNFTGSISSSITIKAPISGTISDITAQIGSPIDATKPIAMIINNSELHLDLFVYEKDLPQVKPGQTIHFTLTNSPGKEYDAVIYSIGTAFADQSKAIPVHARVVNEKSGLIEGMSITARISLGTQLYPSVPDEAIVNNDGKDYIFVYTDGKEEAHEEHGAHEDHEGHDHAKEEGHDAPGFERVQVIKGTSDVGFTEIQPVKSLPEGTKIVVKGAFFLMAKMAGGGEGHQH